MIYLYERQLSQAHNLSEKTEFQEGSQRYKVSLLNCLCINCFILTDNERNDRLFYYTKKEEDRLESPLLLAPIS